MNSSPVVMKAVEQLDYRVTVGDVATQAGLDINMAQAGLLTLASEAGGHLQVSAMGEVVYLFPKDFRSILRNKFFWLQVQELWAKIWRVLFYIIRISFGIVLVASILLMVAAIVVIIIAASASKDNENDNGGDSSGGFGMPNIWFNPFSIFWYSDPYYRGDYHQPQRQSSRGNRSRQNADEEPEAEMNFLMSVFSFIFGDGDPNFDLEEKRWQLVGKVIANNNGAVVAEQIAPYLDKVDGDEDYMIPVLARFNGYPQVSPEGDLIYHFPELQTFAQQRRPSPVPAYLKEEKWKFSRASSGQLTLAGGLGVVNIIAAVVLGSLLQGGEIAAQLGGFVAFVNSIFGILVAYGVGFLAIPLIRYGILQLKNQGINSRNNQRQQQATRLNRAGDEVQRKLSFAQQFAAQNIIGAEDLAYTTETDLLDQEINQKAQIDADWQRRLEQNSPPKHPKNDNSL
jgi:hypothetical protein